MHRAHAEQIEELTRAKVQAWQFARYRGPERRSQSRSNRWWRAHGRKVGVALCLVSAVVVVGAAWWVCR